MWSPHRQTTPPWPYQVLGAVMQTQGCRGYTTHELRANFRFSENSQAAPCFAFLNSWQPAKYSTAQPPLLFVAWDKKRWQSSPFDVLHCVECFSKGNFSYLKKWFWKFGFMAVSTFNLLGPGQHFNVLLSVLKKLTQYGIGTITSSVATSNTWLGCNWITTGPQMFRQIFRQA